jgi:hypothetical protein
MKFTISACLLIGFFISGCVKLPPIQQALVGPLNTTEELYTIIDNSIPKIGEETEVYLGDRMLLQRTGMFKECIRPKFSASKTVTFFHTFTIAANELACKDTPNGNFIPLYINYSGTATEHISYNPIVISSNKDNTYNACVYNLGYKTVCEENVSMNDLNYDAVFVYSDDKFQKVIEYSGKNGNILNFVYSEYSDGMVRQAFTREFKIDLSEGNTVAYKGAILEIIEADNTRIKYKVVRNFK